LANNSQVVVLISFTDLIKKNSKNYWKNNQSTSKSKKNHRLVLKNEFGEYDIPAFIIFLTNIAQIFKRYFQNILKYENINSIKKI